MGPDGVGWGFEFEEPPPGEPEEDDTEDPQAGKREDAARARAPWMVCRRLREKMREGQGELIVLCFLWCGEKIDAAASVVH
jgi:hypothetical protein